MQQCKIINGTIEKVLYEKRDTGYAVLVITYDKPRDSFVAVGIIPNPGREIDPILRGHWSSYSKYGDRFVVESFEYGDLNI